MVEGSMAVMERPPGAAIVELTLVGSVSQSEWIFAAAGGRSTLPWRGRVGLPEAVRMG